MVDEKNQISEDAVSEDDLDKIMKDIVTEEEEAAEAAPEAVVTPISAAPQVTPIRSVEPKRTSSGGGEQALKLEFSGPINLKLQFTTGNRTIELNCTDEALVCRMADGTEFRMPTGATTSTANKKSA